MKPLPLIFALLFGLPNISIQATESSSEISESQAKRIAAIAKPLCVDYFMKNNRIAGAELRCSIDLGIPETIQGWEGRYRMMGRANLRNYKVDANTSTRQQELAMDPNLSAKQIRRIIESETIIKSEVVEFEAILMDLDKKPSIDITLR